MHATETSGSPTAASRKPLVHVGWTLAVDTRDSAIEQSHRAAAHLLKEHLADRFPQFEWRMDFLRRHRYAPRGAIDPLVLLEYGVQEKMLQRWDYALVGVTNDLKARERVSIVGVPSSALETAVLSSAELGDTAELHVRLASLALHLLGHLWGVEHEEHGAMAPPEAPDALQLVSYSDEQCAVIVDRLEEVADKRLEEQSTRWNRPTFYWRSFWADPKSILIDIVGYRPWRLPFQMGRLTAATIVSLVFLLLAAEAWEVGTSLTLAQMIVGAIAAVLVATLFMFLGQNLGQISREVGWREQLARTRIVVFGTLLAGMLALWIVLFLLSLAVSQLLPARVLAGWVGVEGMAFALYLRQAAFMAMIGVLAGALGGNLEDENEFKAELFYDEET